MRQFLITPIVDTETSRVEGMQLPHFKGTRFANDVKASTHFFILVLISTNHTWVLVSS